MLEGDWTNVPSVTFNAAKSDQLYDIKTTKQELKKWVKGGWSHDICHFLFIISLFSGKTAQKRHTPDNQKGILTLLSS